MRDEGRVIPTLAPHPSNSPLIPGWRNGNAPGFDPGDAGSIPAPGACAWIRQLAERLGLNPSVCGFESHSRYSESFVPVEQPGVLVSLSRRRSWVQIPSRTLKQLAVVSRQWTVSY